MDYQETWKLCTQDTTKTNETKTQHKCLKTRTTWTPPKENIETILMVRFVFTNSLKIS